MYGESATQKQQGEFVWHWNKQWQQQNLDCFLVCIVSGVYGCNGRMHDVFSYAIQTSDVFVFQILLLDEATASIDPETGEADYIESSVLFFFFFCLYLVGRS